MHVDRWKSQLTNPRIQTLGVLVAGLTVTLVASRLLTWDFYWDERTFWRTSLMLTDPTRSLADRIDAYPELNTPFPLVLFGLVGRLAGQSPEVARLVSLVAGAATCLMVGWPRAGETAARWAPRSLVGLLVNPYFLFYSARLYTEVVASALAVGGVWAYRRDRPWMAGVLFALAVASRQYTVVFPLAVVAVEVWPSVRRWGQASAPVSRWVPSAVAAGSLAGWWFLLDGFTSDTVLQRRPVPEVQQSFWAIEPGGAIFALAVLGAYFVLVEVVVHPQRSILVELGHWPRRASVIVAAVVVAVIVIPPDLEANGPLGNALGEGALTPMRSVVLVVLASAAAIRFSRGGLETWIVVAHAVVMMKAYQWDKYAVPVLAVLWLLATLDPQPTDRTAGRPATGGRAATGSVTTPRGSPPRC